MQQEIKTAITDMAKKVSKASSQDEAMKYAQAALSMAHTLATLRGADLLDL